MMNTLIQTDRFALSDAERSAIEHELHHYEEPRAASIEALKIVQKARGYVGTWVAGVQTVDHDEFTGATPGTLLRAGR